MENGPFIDDFPIKTSIYSGYSMAMLNNQRVIPMVHPAISVPQRALIHDGNAPRRLLDRVMQAGPTLGKWFHWLVPAMNALR